MANLKVTIVVRTKGSDGKRGWVQTAMQTGVQQ